MRHRSFGIISWMKVMILRTRCAMLKSTAHFLATVYAFLVALTLKSNLPVQISEIYPVMHMSKMYYTASLLTLIDIRAG